MCGEKVNNNSKSKYEHWFKFHQAFIFPAVLGAAFSWFLQAYVTGLQDSKLPWYDWSYAMGLWVLLYQCVWYQKFLHMDASDYDGRGLFTDSIDLFAIVGIFVVLGFVSSETTEHNEVGAYMFILVLGISAAISNWNRNTNSTCFYWAFAITLAIPICGLIAQTNFLNFYFLTSLSEYRPYIVIILMFAVLWCYAYFPNWFQATESH
jgi:hypothetical protein